eukprot:TRINITY_DN81965_c0_g1_i1.p1 TRINITY_DN81965_c0_g1~~TRINITY_DN81965_c0_g1_i1.p1  ORF type:complete len:202 (-),score=52.86 TRINITY_DN81965_c0_g1_i1:997-1602(-)
MSSGDRVEKFAADGEALLKEPNAKKIASEVQKLRTWIHKHQDELLSDSHKEKLFVCMQKYHKYSSAKSSSGYVVPPECIAQVQGLVEDALKVPEGKLITMKTKKQLLKWLEFFGSDGSGSAGDAAGQKEPTFCWDVIEFCDDAVVLMEAETGETEEVEFRGGEEQRAKLKDVFENGGVLKGEFRRTGPKRKIQLVDIRESP